MVQYKWIALSNTSLGVFMGFMNANIVLISLPAIFRGININPFTSFQYLLWILFGYSIVSAILVVNVGRISDIFGRVRMYNIGFAIFTVASILLYLTPGKGSIAALQIISYRILQGVGASFLMANSTAILSEAFPPNQRGFALGLNGVIGIFGGVAGIIIGGILASIYWRDVFLVSVPLGIAGTIWSYKSLKQLSKPNRNQKIDYVGNILYAVALILILIGITYGILPYGTQATGWSNPFVITSIVVGLALFAAFLLAEKKIKDPMFRIELFKVRAFSAAATSILLAQLAFGGLQLMLVLLLQAIWLPLHGYSYEVTPFWAGIYLLPLLAGFGIMGSIAGRLSDRYGARPLSTLGLVIMGIGLLTLTLLPYNFNYIDFALIVFFIGVGNGLFVSPNTAALMNASPPQHRGSASGIRAMLTNTGSTLSIGIFFTIVIDVLYVALPPALTSALNAAGAPQLAPIMAKIPPTAAIFAAFLGYNPVGSILSTLPSSITSSIPATTINTITSTYWFPTVVAPAFMESLRIAFFVASALAFSAAIASALRGKAIIYERDLMKASTISQTEKNS
ncbi:MFS transporter [Sulfolobus sp. A20]|uniref:MFS transporter n=1 Tax=Saccharolobus sp. A20 TaxID=1891280 RepID=UPI000845C1C2|nr:MFS transporter [Sulfolobus sp. A20]TRM75091.1 MFS transporter [Sulfolobus sp. A20-N-F8]TRM79632.1 MFS transporter [Sulfolobus sp. B5]TRM81548.1 MFS transporter [Sulfolobus sp. D5]TRM85357.1 MFS transporter [Sulfolobus sp. F3]TRM89059.1 MFS transporter [Sulfolobus sp. E3]TRM89363.1 MFS transporter [Sulfolobus sp. C3]TRM98299.1 MFS transporter [Sulfolobus sp. E1]TRN04661.1 MFS transporter [Sulfolobus sp. F1]